MLISRLRGVDSSHFGHSDDGNLVHTTSKSPAYGYFCISGFPGTAIGVSGLSVAPQPQTLNPN